MCVDLTLIEMFLKFTLFLYKINVCISVSCLLGKCPGLEMSTLKV